MGEAGGRRAKGGSGGGLLGAEEELLQALLQDGGQALRSFNEFPQFVGPLEGGGLFARAGLLAKVFAAVGRAGRRLESALLGA